MPEVEEEEVRQDEQTAGAMPEALEPGTELQQQQRRSAPVRSMASNDQEAPGHSSGAAMTKDNDVAAAAPTEAAAVAPLLPKPVSTVLLLCRQRNTISPIICLEETWKAYQIGISVSRDKYANFTGNHNNLVSAKLPPETPQSTSMRIMSSDVILCGD